MNNRKRGNAKHEDNETFRMENFRMKMCCRENVVIVIGVKMFRKCAHGIMQMTLFECSNGRITRDHFQNGEV